MFGRVLGIGCLALLIGLGLAVGGPSDSEAADHRELGGTAALVMGAAVSRKGELVRATDQGISSSRPDIGVYVLSFPAQVRDCVYSISVADDNPTGVPPTGFATVGARSRAPNDLFVTTENRLGDQAGRPFHVIVVCAS